MTISKWFADLIGGETQFEDEIEFIDYDDIIEKDLLSSLFEKHQKTGKDSFEVKPHQITELLLKYNDSPLLMNKRQEQPYLFGPCFLVLSFLAPSGKIIDVSPYMNEKENLKWNLISSASCDRDFEDIAWTKNQLSTQGGFFADQGMPFLVIETTKEGSSSEDKRTFDLRVLQDNQQAEQGYFLAPNPERLIRMFE